MSVILARPGKETRMYTVAGTKVGKQEEQKGERGHEEGKEKTTLGQTRRKSSKEERIRMSSRSVAWKMSRPMHALLGR